MDQPQATLQNALANVVFPHLREKSASQYTLNSYRKAVELYSDFAAWEASECQAVQARNGTTNPVSLAIDADDLYRFQRYLVSQRQQSNRNVNKYVGNIQAILRRCSITPGPCKIDSAPKIEKLTERKSAVKLYLRFLTRQEIDEKKVCDMQRLGEIQSLDELSRIYVAAEAAKWPTVDRQGQSIDPVIQWRSAIVMFVLYGFRTEVRAKRHP